MSSPNPEDIKPYVSVGPTKQLSVTVHKETFDSAFIWASVIFGTLLLIIIGLTAFFAYKESIPGPVPPPLKPITPTVTIHSNIGAAANATSTIKGINNAINLNLQHCTRDNNAIIIDGECKCLPPFFGDTCSIQKHDRKYFAVGSASNLQVSIIKEVETPNKSFVREGSPNSCSNYCDTIEGCTGFIYRNNVCSLLSGDVIVPNGSTMELPDDVDLYLLSPNNLYFEDKIFLATEVAYVPARYWLVKESNNYVQLSLLEIHKLKFVPRYVRNYQEYTGIYCTYKFGIDNISIILERGDTTETIIHRPNTKINLPQHWKEKKDLYVVYV